MKTAKNFIYQFLGQGIGKAAIFLFYILMPLLIGPEEYGRFSFALSLSLIIVHPVVEMGLDMVIAKWVSRGRIDVVKKAFVIRITGALIALFLSLTASLFLKVDWKILSILFLYLVLSSFQNVLFSYFKGIEDMKIEGIIVPFQKSFPLLLLFVFPSLGFRDASLGPAILLSSVILGTIPLLFLSREQWRIVMKTNADSFTYSDLIKEGIILGGVTFLWLIYFRIDSVMLGIMRGDLEVGIYNVAYRIMEGIFFIPSIVMIVSFPRLVRHQGFKEIFGKLLLILGTAGLGASALLYLSAPSLIRLIYGQEFLGSIVVLQTLSLALFPVFLGHLTTQSLVALDLSRIYLIVAFIGTLLNISLNYILIPPLGAVGAAWATLLTEISVMLLCGYFVWKGKPDILSSDSLTTAIKEILSLFAKRLIL